MALPAISPSGLTPAPEALARPSPASASPSSPTFGGMLNQMLEGAAQSQTNANAAVQGLALGQTDNLHQAMLQMTQADLQFRLVLEIRNRLTDAYQEIMKMQV